MGSLYLVPKPDVTLERLAQMAVAPLMSKASRASYSGYLRRFLAWSEDQPLTRELVASYVAHMRSSGCSESVVWQSNKAVRLLATEANYRGLVSDRDLAAIKAVRVPKVKGTRSGNWLTLDDVKVLVGLPDRTRPSGLRDGAMIGLMVGCGLRRGEVASITWANYAMRDDRMVLVDLVGKGNKQRTIPVPDWVARDIDILKKTWMREGTVEDPRIIPLSAWTIWARLQRYVALVALTPGHEHCAGATPHDMRRTLAKLMRRVGVPLEQISATLGHANLTTTRLYLNDSIDLRRGSAGVDQVLID